MVTTENDFQLMIAGNIGRYNRKVLMDGVTIRGPRVPPTRVKEVEYRVL
jgi:hypothetical protein